MCLFPIRTLIPHYLWCVLSSHCTVRANRDSTCTLSLMSELINSWIIWLHWPFTYSNSSPAETKSNMNFYHLNISTKKNFVLVAFEVEMLTKEQVSECNTMSSWCCSESGVLLASVMILISRNQIVIIQSKGASPKANPFHFCWIHRQRC